MSLSRAVTATALGLELGTGPPRRVRPSRRVRDRTRRARLRRGLRASRGESLGATPCGAHTEAIAARVGAACKAPIVWPAVEAALALYREQGELPFVDDDPDD